jgi:HEAT repeat protein
MIHTENVTAPLVGVLKHPQPEIRANAAWALGFCENQTALTALQGAQKDGDERVRKSAAAALDRLRSALAAGNTNTVTAVNQ